MSNPRLITGREDVDVVSMATYTADMEEHTKHATSIIDALKKRAEVAEKLVAQLVLAAGGKIEIFDRDLESSTPIELTVYRNVADMKFVWTARKKEA